jgi:predicted aconitase
LNDDSDYGAMGYFIGMQVANKSIAVEGLPRTVTFDQLKYLIAPAAASGSIHVFHVIGVTPEALTKQAAFGGKEPQSIIKVSRKDIEATKKIFAFNKNKEVDLLLLGCPHITIQEAGTISDFLKNRKLKQGKRLWLAMGKPVYTLAKTMGFADNIEAAGGVISDTCLATIPDSPIPKDVKVVLTNSFKCAHYVRSLQKDQVEVMVAGLHDCLESITEKVGEVQ